MKVLAFYGRSLCDPSVGWLELNNETNGTQNLEEPRQGADVKENKIQRERREGKQAGCNPATSPRRTLHVKWNNVFPKISLGAHPGAGPGSECWFLSESQGPLFKGFELWFYFRITAFALI